MSASGRRSSFGTNSVRGINYSSSPLLTSPTPRGRRRLLMLIFALGFAVLAAKAFYVQVVASDFYQRKGEESFAYTQKLMGSRGRILDRNGETLALSVSAPTVGVVPRLFKPKDKQLAEMLLLLGMTEQEFRSRMPAPDKDGQFSSAYLTLRQHVDEAVGRKLGQLHVEGVQVEKGFVRRYPAAEAAAHVVGYTDLSDLGIDGIEAMRNTALTGRGGERNVIRDRFGRVVEEVGDPEEAADGQDVRLTLDAQIQSVAYRTIRDAVTSRHAQSGSVVVLDAQTGDILAMALYPSFNPEHRRKPSLEVLRNRVLTDPFEPGSTVKPFVVGLALEKRLVRPDLVIDTRPFRIGNLMVSDGSHGHPSLTLSQVIQKSSNVGTVRAAQGLDDRDLGDLFARLGFGSKPQLGFSKATNGRLRPWKSWRATDRATICYGYGLSASLLQIARAYTALARDGEMVELALVQDAQRDPPVRVFSPETARTMRQMLRGTVTAEGTAKGAALDGYSAGGKTGTAQVFDKSGYRSDRHRAYFAGLAPIEQPRVVVAVLVDEPQGEYYGGLVAGPVFKTVAEQSLRLLGVQPDAAIRADGKATTAGATATPAAPGAPGASPRPAPREPLLVPPVDHQVTQAATTVAALSKEVH